MKLIEEWRQWWKLWSIRFTTVGTILLAYITAVPDAVFSAWVALPDEFKSFIPSDYLKWVTVGLLVLGIISRLVKQNGISKGSDKREP